MAKVINFEDYHKKENHKAKSAIKKLINIDDFKYGITGDFGKDMDRIIKIYKKSNDVNDKIILELYYQFFMETVKNTINQLSDRLKDEYGIGFIIVKQNCESYPSIHEYFAKHMLQDIYITDYNFNLEDYLHQKYNTKEEFLKTGIEKFIINFTYRYDKYLSRYLTCNIDLISDIKHYINNIISNWDIYEEELKRKSKSDTKLLLYKSKK